MTYLFKVLKSIIVQAFVCGSANAHNKLDSYWKGI